jgi:hypothetical protein
MMRSSHILAGSMRVLTFMQFAVTSLRIAMPKRKQMQPLETKMSGRVLQSQMLLVALSFHLTEQSKSIALRYGRLGLIGFLIPLQTRINVSEVSLTFLRHPRSE